MQVKLQYITLEDRASLLLENTTLRLMEDQRLLDGNFLIFTDEPYFYPFTEPEFLRTVKESKQTEIDYFCKQAIAYGFQSSIKDGLQPYYLTAEVESEINILINQAAQGKSVPFKNANQQICVVWTSEEFIQFYKEATTYGMGVKFYKDGIMRMIELCQTFEDYNAIQWGVQLPADIQAEIDATIADLQSV